MFKSLREYYTKLCLTLNKQILHVRYVLHSPLSAFDKKRKENCWSEAVKKRPCLTTNGRSLDAFSETQTIFSFLSTAAAFFVYFLGL